jgi:DNA gyrase subunit B
LAIGKQHAPQRYGNESIESLKGADRVRKRPGVIFGSDGIEGCQHAVFEILSNSIDEARSGFVYTIFHTKYENDSIEVEDFGRGCPVDWNSVENRYNWELVFCELYAGGKYRQNDTYEYSLGLNGLGSCATQYSSEYMDVTVWRDGKKYTLHFEKGSIVGELNSEEYKGRRTGSLIRWKPDLEVFTDIKIPEEYFHDTLKSQAVVNPKVKFIYRKQAGNKFEEHTYCYENGICDYILELAGEDTLTGVRYIQTERQGRDRKDKPEYKVKLSCAFLFSNNVSIIEHYHNSSYLEYGGSPEKALKSAFVSVIDQYLRQNSKYLKDESKITFGDIQDCLVFISNNFSTHTSYENQTKKAINNRFIQEAMTDFLKEQLQVYFIENPPDAEKISEQVLINKRSRETAEKTRRSIRKKLSGGLDISNRVEKFVDCRTRDVSRRELYIVEGDSALGSVKMGRDAEFQAVMPVRGKIFNCLKADLPRIFKSDVITDLVRVLGCGVEVSHKYTKDLTSFDLSALRWSKIIICTDADVDGFHIRTLILAMLYRLTPTLIQKGYVYIAESPLYEITCKGKTYFAYKEQEKAKIIADLGDAKYTVNRSKGLGENEADMMWHTTMNPATRRLIRVTPDDAKRTAELFDLLLGDNISGRKEFIAEEGYKYIDLSYVS